MTARGALVPWAVFTYSSNAILNGGKSSPQFCTTWKTMFQPHLKYHHLRAKLKGFQAISITPRFRIPLTVLITEKEIHLLDVGSHDEVYR